MAWTYLHPKSGIYHVGFWYEGFQYRKSLRTRDKRKAGEHAKSVTCAINAMKSGRDKEGLKLIRHNISVVDVIFPTAKVKQLLDEGDRKPLQLKKLHDLWMKHLTDEGRAHRTIETTKHRLVDILDILGMDFRVDYLTKEDLAKYINKRRENGISEYTIKREVGLFRSVIDNAVSFEWLSTNPVKAWPRLKPNARKEFLPRNHVEDLLASHDLDENEIEDLRSRMLLSVEDMADLVSFAPSRPTVRHLPPCKSYAHCAKFVMDEGSNPS